MCIQVRYVDDEVKIAAVQEIAVEKLYEHQQVYVNFNSFFKLPRPGFF